MKRFVEKLSENEILKQYPIGGRLDGWYFRLTETSNNAWLAEGSNQWGRKVSCRGGDEIELLQECVAMAQSLGGGRST
jgi:hypothetical protein